MDHDRFADFLENALALATAVFEAPTFGYTEAAPAQCFPKVEQHIEKGVTNACSLIFIRPLMTLFTVHE